MQEEAEDLENEAKNADDRAKKAAIEVRAFQISRKKLNDVTRKTEPKTCVVILYSQKLRGRDTWELPRIFRLFWQPQKIPTKITPSEKNTCQIFLPKKYLGIKIFKPKNILWPSPSLE